MSASVIKSNKHLMDPAKRREMLLESALASFKLEGIDISRETAADISRKINSELNPVSY